MKPTTTPTKEMKFERHHEQHIREPMHLEDDEQTGQERWPAAITSPKPGSLTPQTTTPARRTTRTPPETVGQTTNPIPQIGKKTYPILATENGSSPDVPVAGDEAEADAVAAEEGHEHKLRTDDLDSE